MKVRLFFHVRFRAAVLTPFTSSFAARGVAAELCVEPLFWPRAFGFFFLLRLYKSSPTFLLFIKQSVYSFLPC